MSIKGRPAKIFTIEDWDEASRLDKLYIYMVDTGRWSLPDAEIEYLEGLTKAWTIMMEAPDHRGRAKEIVRTLDVVEKTAYKMMQDATYLFGDILKFDHDLELKLAMSRLQYLSKMAQEDGDYKTAVIAMDKAMDISREIEARKPAALRTYQPLVLTTNVAALHQIAETVDYEDEPGS